MRVQLGAACSAYPAKRSGLYGTRPLCFGLEQDRFVKTVRFGREQPAISLSPMQAKVKDLDEIYAFLKKVPGLVFAEDQGKLREEIKKSLQQGNTLVMYSEGRLIGVASLKQWDSNPRLANLLAFAVHPAYRRPETAEALFKKLMENARQKESKWLSWETEKPGLFKRLGAKAEAVPMLLDLTPGVHFVRKTAALAPGILPPEPANNGDLDEICSFLNSIFGYAQDRKALQETIQKGGTLIIHDAENRRIIATASLLEEGVEDEFGKAGYIHSIATAPEYRGKGLASILCNALIEMGISKGLTVLGGETTNPDARHLYEHLGAKVQPIGMRLVL